MNWQAGLYRCPIASFTGDQLLHRWPTITKCYSSKDFQAVRHELFNEDEWKDADIILTKAKEQKQVRQRRWNCKPLGRHKTGKRRYELTEWHWPLEAHAKAFEEVGRASKESRSIVHECLYPWLVYCFHDIPRKTCSDRMAPRVHDGLGDYVPCPCRVMYHRFRVWVKGRDIALTDRKKTSECDRIDSIVLSKVSKSAAVAVLRLNDGEVSGERLSKMVRNLETAFAVLTSRQIGSLAKAAAWSIVHSDDVLSIAVGEVRGTWERFEVRRRLLRSL